MLAFTSPATERLYGGAAGGGKSHLERVESIALCLDIPGLQYYLFRRSYQDLIKSYVEGPTGYRAMLGELIHEGQVEAVAKEIRFPNESKIYLCHCQYEKDVFGFGSFEFHVLNIAEAGEFTPFMMNYLRSRVRVAREFQEKLPKKYWIPKQYWRDPKVVEYQIPKISLSCNPIGPGKVHLQDNFVDCAKPESIWRAPDDQGGMLRQFIPAKLDDNPSLDKVGYTAQLRGIGSPGYVDALLKGRWDTTIGAYFAHLDRDIHEVEPFVIPSHWPLVMAMDWGGCGDGDPFAIGWWAISDGSIPLYPRKSAILYRLWYGEGLPQQTVKDVALGIKQREVKDGKILYRVAGRDIFAHRGGPSIAQDFATYDIMFKMADNERIPGWQQTRNWIKGRNDRPDLYAFNTYPQWFKYMASLQYDPIDSNDCAQEGDHIPEMTRYFVMSRAYPKDAPPAPINKLLPPKLTPDNLWAELERRRY